MEEVAEEVVVVVEVEEDSPGEDPLEVDPHLLVVDTPLVLDQLRIILPENLSMLEGALLLDGKHLVWEASQH